MPGLAEDLVAIPDSDTHRMPSGIHAKRESSSVRVVAPLTDADCFASQRARRLALEDAAPPHADPSAVIAAALAMAERLGRPGVARKIAALASAGACRAELVDELTTAARALRHLTSSARADDGEAPRSAARIDEAREVRSLLIARLDAERGADDDARLWIDVARATNDDADVAFDLRALARRARGDLWAPATPEAEAVAQRASDLADSLDLRGRSAEARDDLARSWTLLAALYEGARDVTRLLAHRDGAQAPSLAAIERRRRRHEEPISPEPAARAPRLVVVTPPPFPQLPILAPVPDPHPAPAPAPAPERPSVESSGVLPKVVLDPSIEALAESLPPVLPELIVDESEILSVPPPEPDPEPELEPLPPADYAADVEIDPTSDSNLYVGFTDDLSTAGVFVATYLARPLGSTVDLSVGLPGGDRLRLRGHVEWLREPSWSSDVWPGMGVRLDATSEDTAARLLAFLGTRDPLFFTE
jgi:hypothetical protein